MNTVIMVAVILVVLAGVSWGVQHFFPPTEKDMQEAQAEAQRQREKYLAQEAEAEARRQKELERKQERQARKDKNQDASPQ